MEQKIITVVGGSGFIGRYVVKLLAAAGYTVRVICRNPDAALHLKTAGSVGQIVLTSGNLADPASLSGKLDNSYAVINLVGVLFEKSSQNFTALHAQGAEALAHMAKEWGAQRFIHVSALGIDKPSSSHYARSKLLGEQSVRMMFPEATILRPSVVFGPEDNFFNLFAGMACLAPALPLIGGGHTRFQPVYVGDVAQAVMASLKRPDTMRHTYELGGPRVYTFREILEYILRTIDRRRPLVPLPFSIASLKATFLELLPRPPLTRDQVKLLKVDNMVSPEALTLNTLGISPTAVEIIVPAYLARYNRKKALEAGFDKKIAA